jgi:hypothetical protein
MLIIQEQPDKGFDGLLVRTMKDLAGYFIGTKISM